MGFLFACSLLLSVFLLFALFILWALEKDIVKVPFSLQRQNKMKALIKVKGPSTSFSGHVIGNYTYILPAFLQFRMSIRSH